MAKHGSEFPTISTTNDILTSENSQQIGRDLIRARLRGVYAFAQEQIREICGGKSAIHEDVGTYNGLGQKVLLDVADRVISFDRNDSRLAEAASREELQQPLQEGRLRLIRMDATAIDPTEIPNESCTSATLIEVLGASFDGHPSKIQDIFRGISGTLRKGAPLIFTMRSPAADELLKALEWRDKRGVPLPHYSLEQYLLSNGLFSEVQWFGQIVMHVHEDDSLTIPPLYRNGRVYAESYVPRPVEENEQPQYWVGVAVK